MVDPKKYAEFIEQNISGCRFVGISDDMEMFISFDHEDPELELGAAKNLRKQFPEISKIITVVQPNIKQMQMLVDALNDMVQGKDQPQKPLMDIEEF